MKPFCKLAFAAALFWQAGAVHAANGNGIAPAGSPNKLAAPSPTPPKLTVPIPPGHDAEGVDLPYFDAAGRLQMYFTIKLATRLDENHMKMTDANMQTYDAKGAPETGIFLTSSVLDLNTRIVTSDVPVTVQRSDFSVRGDMMTFDTQKHFGVMKGHILMTVYGGLGGSKASPSPRPGPAASPGSGTAATAPAAAPPPLPLEPPRPKAAP